MSAFLTRHRQDLAPLIAVGIGLLVYVRSTSIIGPGPGAAVAVVGLLAVLVGALLNPRAGLTGVVAALPFYRFGADLAGQSFGVSEVALLLTALAVGLRAINGRFRIVCVAGPASREAGSADEVEGGPPPRPYETALAPDPSPASRRGEAGDGSPLSHLWERGAGGVRAAPWDRFDGPIILFLAAALLSLLATEYLRLSLRELRTLIVEPVLFWYLCRSVLHRPRDLGWLVGALLVSAALVAVVGLAQVVVGGAVTDVQGVRRVLGTYTSPNHFALLLGRALPFLVAVAWMLPRWRVAAGAGALLCGGALLATFSVGGWLATGLALLVVVGLLGGRRVVLAMVVAGVVAASVLFAAAPVERLAGRLDPRQGTSFVRVQLWQAAVTLGSTSPVLGIGLDNFLYRYPTAIPPGTPYEPNLSHPHNLLLQFWLQLGVGGVAALCWLLVCFWRLVWPAAQRGGVAAPSGAVVAADMPLRRALAVGALGSMTDFVAHGLVDNGYFLPDMAVIFWLTLAAGAVLGTRSR